MEINFTLPYENMNFDFSNTNYENLNIKVELDALGLGLSNYDKKRDLIRKEISDKYNLPNNCILLDQELGRLTKDIATYRTNNNLDNLYLLGMEEHLEQGKVLFESKDCRNLIEEKRLNETALLSTKFAIEQERNVLDKSKIEQRIYIATGTILVLVGLYIILKK